MITSHKAVLAAFADSIDTFALALFGPSEDFLFLSGFSVGGLDTLASRGRPRPLPHDAARGAGIARLGDA